VCLLCKLSDEYVCAGKAASIADMCIMPDEFKRRLSDCGQYCPVSLANNELIDCSSYTRLNYAAEFQGELYVQRYIILYFISIFIFMGVGAQSTLGEAIRLCARKYVY